MTTRRMIAAALGALGGALLAGCGTTDVVKECGIYTTLAVEGQRFDLPGDQYRGYRTFGPDQTPAAVVTGYGHLDAGINNAQPYAVEVVEAATGAVIFKFDGRVYAGRAAVMKLPIQRTGDYTVKLLINNTVYDTWAFHVTRAAAASATGTGAKPPVYAQGIMHVGVEPMAGSDAFTQYDASLCGAILDSITRQVNKRGQDVFVQVEPGELTAQFKLDERGTVSSARLLESTLNDALAQFFLGALQAGSPYRAWPEAARRAASNGERDIKVTFRLE